MTTIVAVEGAESTVFAADTRVTGGHVNDGWANKVVRNGEYIFAGAGYVRALQLVQYAKLPAPPVEGVVDRFVTVELIPAIKEAFGDAEAEALINSILPCSIRGRVYEVTGDGAWVRDESGLYAIGSGAEYALGALAAGATPKGAVEIASRYDAGTNSDVKVLSA